jgi:hypothetical protein
MIGVTSLASGGTRILVYVGYRGLDGAVPDDHIAALQHNS